MKIYLSTDDEDGYATLVIEENDFKLSEDVFFKDVAGCRFRYIVVPAKYRNILKETTVWKGIQATYKIGDKPFAIFCYY